MSVALCFSAIVTTVSPLDLDIVDTRAFVLSMAGLHVADVSDPSAMSTLIQTGDANGHGLAVSGDVACLLFFGDLVAMRLDNFAIESTLVADAFVGSGFNLSNLNASALSAGTVHSNVLTGTYSKVLQFSNPGNTYAGNGAALTNLNAGNLVGTILPSRLPTGGSWALSSALNIDSDTLVIDAPNNRVGIGIASPAASLGVSGNVHITGNLGMGLTNPGAPIHVLEGASLAITPSANAACVLERNSSANYLHILGHDTTELGIMFGTPSNSASGGIYYNSGSTPSGFNFRTSNNTAKMVLLSTGSVGIGTTAPTQLLSVNGTAGKPGGGSWSTFSDIRLKKNIQPLNGALDRMLALEGVSFEYIDPTSINEIAGMRVGMIAQDVEQVFPDWVSESSQGHKMISFSGFEALTVEAMRELRAEMDAEIAQQAKRIDGLERENAELRRRLERVEALLR